MHLREQRGRGLVWSPRRFSMCAPWTTTVMAVRQQVASLSSDAACSVHVMCVQIGSWRSASQLTAAALIYMIAWMVPTAGVADSDEHLRAPCEMTIEFRDPRDWRCAGDETAPCRVCRNTSDHSSELHMRCVGETEGMRRNLPPGAELEICHGSGRGGV